MQTHDAAKKSTDRVTHVSIAGIAAEQRGKDIQKPDCEDKGNAELALQWHLQSPDGPHGKRQYEKVRHHVPIAAKQKREVYVGAPSGQPWLRDLCSWNASADQATHATKVESCVGPDKSLIDPVDKALMDRYEDFHEEKENGKLGEHDPDAVKH